MTPAKVRYLQTAAFSAYLQTAAFGAYRKFQAIYVDPELSVIRTPQDPKFILIPSLNGMIIYEFKPNFEQDGGANKGGNGLV